ncbi:acetyl/propionyl/methylcrotonyl-CoA carboxylase subunit alpha [Acinetobacter nosocomialis]|uniref:acetyl/propionyl/methylcrotonyl-CoA carboxylase subunit alpha n=1 Tax=Acinetobacter calcoaceticus/baumannii complex TaxID=909768 RepID=UPI000446DF68|nr:MULTISPECIES: acetyl/propionyl/methylcrotonyl-CoA carboxylase subunit alpha [Acinetobacter calcoaceticus/baumannii complex]EXE75570.1 ATP-grasp domain protein [Acinetobacter sp. 1566109]MBJ9962483.1 acetyl/propionyl/methylcrotonyl-CoA carboxylase subunit alpha [Acinetobacter nosocomialis]MBP1479317.1 acetyl/propionyl/methylcrotonyl-CoA carboxylase subunit alpha [Acinetobacter nosocomialis]MBP1513726.1 acetyl/propionyl/methylcrotonyl-CoA carboxylase subunit alpha [Acinetobacter nosocomialis]
MKFSKILVANRGEIAVRVMQTAKAMGYQTVAVYSDADSHARHVQEADEAVYIGASKVSESYLSIAKIIEACKKTGADAVHPGYGFLSENTDFAQACIDNQITFIGPTASAIELMGSKRLSKIAMIEAGVPCVPGYEGDRQDLEYLAAQAEQIGFPIMVKASAGGGGRGMRLVQQASELVEALQTARSEAENAFGSGELILEKAVIAPRHVEIQVFGDTHGNYVYLFERDCSIQRRHQKVVEEAPCPVMTPELRQQMGEAAVATAKACAYVGAGTVEFLLDASGAFYFLEMNTRLQVEHPVTELITGLDLVEWQLRVANGEHLPLKQQELNFNGHAIEVRLYAEDPRQDFLPQTGKVLRWKPATLPNVRIDHGMLATDEVSPFYDPMVAKVIAYGKTREDAIRLLARAVDDSVLLGVNSNKQFLVNLLRHPVVVGGDTNTAFIQQHFQNDPSLHHQVLSLETLAIAAALFSQNKGTAVWQTGLGVPLPLKLQIADQQIQLQVSSVNNTFTAQFCDQSVCIDVLERTSEYLVYLIDGIRRRVQYVLDSDQLYLDRDNGNIVIRNVTYAAPEATDVAGDGKIRAPMDGAVVNILVNKGDQVVRGQTLLVLEAMKIQQQIKADVDGVVEDVLGQQGQQVKKRQMLFTIQT